MEDKEDLIKKLSELNNILSDMTDEKKPSKGKPSEKAASSDHAPKRSESEGSEHPARPREAARVHKPFRLPEEDPAPKTEPAESETAEPVPDPGDEAVEQPSAPPPPPPGKRLSPPRPGRHSNPLRRRELKLRNCLKRAPRTLMRDWLPTR